MPKKRITFPYKDKTAAYDNLKNVKQIMEDNDIEYFLTFATCLGLIRDNGFISYANDLDIGIKFESREKLELLKKILEDNKYNHEWTYYLSDVDYYSRFQRTNKILSERHGEKSVASYHYRRNNILVDISIIHPFDEKYAMYGPTRRFENRFFDNCEYIKYNDEYFSIPSPVEDFLEATYGDWRTPLSSKEWFPMINGSKSSRRFLSKNYPNLYKTYWGDVIKLTDKQLDWLANTFKYKALRERYRVMEEYFDIHKGDVIIDGGSFHGDMSLYFSKKVGNTGKVYAYEPLDENFELLTNFIKNNRLKNVHPSKIALWHEEAKLPFFLSEYANAGSIFKDFRKVTDHYKEIQANKLDNLVDSADYIWMNIEGAEISALIGAKKLLMNNDVKLCISTHKVNDEYSTTKDVINILKSYGYKTSLVKNHEMWVYAERKWHK